ncbi:kinesin [Trypanosoma rangeli SC58]|uniref:Kinesin-like protein n=1 Tax=Trypanosoma rangeli SC58 TaxID=429131 RepID=A0A061J2K1_TRYRA|nr:kinesin [Trypanosoma rangeli SC58]
MSNIKVAVRCRPLFENERPAVGLDFHQGRRILLDNKTYDPDFIFPSTATQEEVFAVCQPILQSVKDGLHGTVMVYGQTGTGKTHTMLGAEGEANGIAHRMIAAMLEHVQQRTLEDTKCALTLSMIEIYNEKLTDMLSDNGDAEVTLVAGFPKVMVKLTLSRLSEAHEAIQRGLCWRRTATTLMNERSSRSHVVLILDLEEQNAYTETVDVAHLFMVDLAGSESLKKSQASGIAANETGKINKSLLALKSVFLALANSNEATRPSHVPYRDSKLTELLRDSIGGTARTLMIACVSAVGRDIEETKSTLLYAVKAKSIRNAANTERERLLVRLRSFELENQRLRNRLQERVLERGGYYVNREEHERLQQMAEEHQSLKVDVEDLMRERQQSEAMQHINTSQVTIFRAIMEEKEDELRRFKQTYHEALLHFDAQMGSLQRVVQEAVRGAYDAAQRSAETVVEQLEAWRADVLREGNGEPQAGEKGGGAEGAEALAFSRDYEEEAVRLVKRINDGFCSLRQEVLDVTGRHCAAVQALQRRRRASLESLERTMQEQVRDVLSAHAREQARLDKELEDEHSLFESGIAATARQTTSPAEALPFRHLVRNICRDAVESSKEHFPLCAVSDNVAESLQHINEAFRVNAASASLKALVQMGNMPPPRSSNSSISTATTSMTAAAGTPAVASTGNTPSTSAVACGELSRPLSLSGKDVNRAAGGGGAGRMKRHRSDSAMSDSRRTSLRGEK